MDKSNIRNFCIIAHIDHGKSTLADRLLEITGTISKREMKNQVLDKMDLEREKGITIKLAPVRMQYKGYEFNLIDTPGHADFSYEVSRSLAACEGAILVVDASQGIQAQTLANVYLAMEANLKIIPVINKIDLPAANVEKVKKEIADLLGKNEEVILISAKTGQNVDQVLDRIISDIPSPTATDKNSLRALVFDSFYDEYRGVVLYVRVFDGNLKSADNIKLMGSKFEGIALETGALTPNMQPLGILKSGEIGYVVTNFKSTKQAKVGDTITLLSNPASEALSGYREVKPFVYAGFFPESNEKYNELKDAIDKLSLSDSALQYSLESSPVLGFGIRIGFLGLLHLEIVKERFEREYGLSLIVTNPSTNYRVDLTDGSTVNIKSAAELPDHDKISAIYEPWVKGEIIAPNQFVGAIIQLITKNRGNQKNINYLEDRAIIDFQAPLANLLTDFYDSLKSITSGYGSFNYEIDDFRQEDIVRLDFYVAGDRIDALSIMVHRTEAQRLGRVVVEKLKQVIPRQNFQVALQAAIGGKFIAREDLSAYRKDVTSGLYGGDVSRKKKVLAKQKKGKERMKRFGRIDIPAEAFTVMLSRE